MSFNREASSRELKVAVAGFGTVGQAAIRLLQEDRERFRQKLGIDLRLVTVLDRSHRRKDRSWTRDVTFTDSLDEFLAAPADIIVELVGGIETANRIVRNGLERGKPVVTANKLLMARCGTDLLKLVARKNAFLGFEASVAGGIPIIRVVRRCLFSDQIVRVRGILNGTCNFILSEMAAAGRDYGSVLSEAQARGYAEADPSLDVSGGDAADKLAILSTLCFNQAITPHLIPTRGITEITAVDLAYARKLDATIKLLGLAERTKDTLSLRVTPFLIDNRVPLSKISGVLNAVEVTGSTLGSVVVSGEGAGGGPTAVSVVADILNAALWMRGATEEAGVAHPGELDPALGLEADQMESRSVSQENECYPFYLRFVVQDRPGIISALSHILAEREINIDSVLQESWPDRSNLPFVITVERTPVSTMEAAVEEMGALAFNCAPPFVLPVLRE